MPAVSKAQYRLFAAVKHNKEFAKKAGIPQSVGREFVGKPNKKFYKSLPEKKPMFDRHPVSRERN